MSHFATVAQQKKYTYWQQFVRLLVVPMLQEKLCQISVKHMRKTMKQSLCMCVCVIVKNVGIEKEEGGG